MSKKQILWLLSVIFGILAVILYFASQIRLDRGAAELFKTNTIVNIQGTVFCAASAVICALCAIGAILTGVIEEKALSITRGQEEIKTLIANHDDVYSKKQANADSVLGTGKVEHVSPEKNVKVISSEPIASEPKEIRSAGQVETEEEKKPNDSGFVLLHDGRAKCTQCGYVQPRGKEACEKCGAIFNRYISERH